MRGLGGVDHSAIEKVRSDELNESSKGIYNLMGVRMPYESISNLPAGLYIINGKKVMISR
ncbi:MAG: hypothetical protein IJ081_06120 [Prevotella sp.]|nr:hypothetical protein [Prevotella sp.]